MFKFAPILDQGRVILEHIDSNQLILHIFLTEHKDCLGMVVYTKANMTVIYTNWQDNALTTTINNISNGNGVEFSGVEGVNSYNDNRRSNIPQYVRYENNNHTCILLEARIEDRVYYANNLYLQGGRDKLINDINKMEQDNLLIVK